MQTITKTAIPENYLQAEPALLEEKIRSAKKQLGKRLLILGHHYQKDEIIQFVDEVGDSLQLAQKAEMNQEAEFIVFCGVHFMAETADMLTQDNQKVILPDTAAGCSMADMASLEQLEIAWEKLQENYPEEIIPITYINSTAAVKSFVGAHGGTIVTSSNAENILKWAFTQKKRVFFLPDQHLGRNTAFHMGIPLSEMALWHPASKQLKGDLSQDIKIILWQGHCCVHQQFTPAQITALRAETPEIKIIVHPECPHEVVEMADAYGSTGKIINTVKNSPKETVWGVGTDTNLVTRMQKEMPERDIRLINPRAHACGSMNRIILPNLAWCLDQLCQGEVVNQITVEPTTRLNALKGLKTMLALS